MAQQEKLVSMSGTVVNSATGEPVKHAMVQITRITPGDGIREQPVTRTATTDASGAFRFDGIPDGRYLCAAQKPQFENPPGGNDLCAPGGDVRIPLSPLGVITGRVVDQDGLPLRAVNIYALSTRVVDGLRHTRTDRSVTTDDRGMYRLWNLAPGKYLIKASGLAAGTSSFVGDTSSTGIGEAYETVYFGAAKTRDSATPIDLKPGGEAVADLTVTVEHGYSVRGVLQGITPRGPTVRFETLVARDATPVRVSLNNETGRFTVLGLAARSYILRATQDKSIAEIPISIPGADVSGVSMRLEPGMNIPVAIRFTNERPKDSEPDSFFQPGAYCTAQLWTEDGNALSFQGESIAAVRPGRYHATAFCLGAYPVSVTYGAQDLMTDPAVTIPAGAPIPIEVLATYGGGRVSIHFAGTSKPMVVLIPRSRGEPVVFQGAVDADIAMTGIRPGPYTAYAFHDAQEAEYRNPDFVRTLAGGVPVQIEDGKETKVTIPGVSQ